MKYKILKDINFNGLFVDIPLKLAKKLDRYYELKLFLTVPNLNKVDVLELFECEILHGSGFNGEIDETVFSDYLLNFYEKQSLMASYVDDYIALIGQLFLAGYIGFYRSLYEKNEAQTEQISFLSEYKKEKIYEVCRYFRDNYFGSIKLNRIFSYQF
ncbi:hypothetical protein [Campylobacter troglodytis]|uniref:hypothetical protein n=1 Tax=Campylobacter troglodytis TaxID=654363 RepID=UPI00115C302C|nr:hypothetical protein [Campylobacter troglodytis]TQR57284.1 hypothetical protein DMC01_08640 [Campylobacter troglodytis]